MNLHDSQQLFRKMNRRRGFSLIELLIVMVIVLILAVITVPNLMRARISANESSAVVSVRAINTAEVSYFISFPSNGYATVLANLGGAAPCTATPAAACLIDNVLASGTKSGYTFAAAGDDGVNGINSTYAVGAAPVHYNQSGMRKFCSTEDGVIRYLGSNNIVPNAAACKKRPH